MKTTDENDKRAMKAGAAMAPEYGNFNARENIADLLTDLQHLCKVQNVDFEECLTDARGHFEAETANPISD